MHSRLLPLMILFAAACGDSGPETDKFVGLWRLTSVNAQPLPAAGNATAGEVWAAAVLEVSGEIGFFDRCMEAPSTSTRTGRSTPVILAATGRNRVSVAYFDRRANAPDTASLSGTQLTLRYRNTLTVPPEVDVLTFAPLEGALPVACSLVP